MKATDDATVDVAQGLRATFIRLLESSDKAATLRGLNVTSESASRLVYRVDCSSFRDMPNTPFAYWVGRAFRELFESRPSLMEVGLVAKQGLATADDFRFVRLFWEVVPGHALWWTFAKGGRMSPFYADISEVVKYGCGANEIRSNINSSGTVRSNIWMLKSTERDFFGRAGLTWPVRAGRFSPRALPPGCVFSHRGYSAFIEIDRRDWLWSVFNSSLFDYLFKLCLGRFGHPEFLVGILPLLPSPPDPDASVTTALSALANRGWSFRRSVDSINEVSHAFLLAAVLQVEGASFAARLDAWSGRVSRAQRELDQVQSEVDELCFELYGISGEDQRAITEGFGVDAGEGAEDGDGLSSGVGDLLGADPEELAAGLVSWAVGVGVGRFDVQLATGVRGWPDEPGPFDHLPVCSPAMLTGGDGLPLDQPPAGYPVLVSPVLVDDPGHELDITARVRAVFDEVFGADADEWWADVGHAVETRRGEIGAWLGKGFFDHHLKAHSKSKRKAPILWPIGTASGSYLVWLYAHRVTGDSLFQVLNDTVGPKLGLEQRWLGELIQEAGPNPSASQRKAIDAHEMLVGELRELRDDLEAVTPLWAPDLNDGIVILLAPLWKLFAHHKPWSRELKKHWDKLAAGQYDWAQLAMHLWPERVIPKCAQRSQSRYRTWPRRRVLDARRRQRRQVAPPPLAHHTDRPLLVANRHNPATTATLQWTTR